MIIFVSSLFFHHPSRRILRRSENFNINKNCSCEKLNCVTKNKRETIAPKKHSAFRGLAISLRRTGRASADVATGRGVLSLPHSQRTLLAGSHRLRFPTGVYVLFLR